MPIYTVSQITGYVKNVLESDSLLTDLWIRGEVSNYTKASSGHMYFTMKDDLGQLRCVMFRTGTGGQHLAAGKQVVIHGRFSVYEQRGDIQLIADLAQPDGIGKRFLELELLRAQLEKEGLFNAARKRPLPQFPSKIAVVTSPSGAVFHDIRQVISRRYPLVQLLLAPAQVQGDGAVESVVSAFETLNTLQDIDLVILARGGGSDDELWTFNDQRVVKAIFSSRAPVISAVGHETNTTLADYVADVRAPTPSAAAELAVPDRLQLALSINEMVSSMNGCIQRTLVSGREDLQGTKRRLAQTLPDIDAYSQQVDDLTHIVVAAWGTMLGLQKERLGGYASRLATLDPKATLRRGYAVVTRSPAGGVIYSKGQVAEGDTFKVALADGSFEGKVTENKS
ncbi:MAG: exodeoxyribonuclease VII large subunit [Dehalococcoidia bacterium]|nr:exodeoxyribonuclease VII large subunit [Dehalococcoidia bacterium]